ncbi:hypothetical protein O181_062146 [Austropuccinia psidii MF-1]|uniref:Uncharacterized protein n=1 Tax=Austropuccinia psidii MF-1 TaxID=1389203 RepID=A0A9Q3HY70_9BASI|nr:hypothetical protein [Austropuccinia psidii MF-1]
MCGENGSKCKEYLPLVTLADRISTKRTTGYSQFELQFGQKAVLPIDIKAKTYLTNEWHKVKSTEDLLEARAEQLSGKEEIRKRAKEKLKKARDDSVRYWNRKLADQIRKPVHPVVRQINKGLYELEELDGKKLARRYAASQIKKLYPRGKELDSEEEEEEGEEEAEYESQF